MFLLMVCSQTDGEEMEGCVCGGEVWPPECWAERRALMNLGGNDFRLHI